jgi:hypothetical protein
MKLRHIEKKQYETTLQQADAIADGQTENWEEVLKAWNAYYGVKEGE